MEAKGRLVLSVLLVLLRLAAAVAITLAAACTVLPPALRLLQRKASGPERRT